jgi:hypothetical protein
MTLEKFGEGMMAVGGVFFVLTVLVAFSILMFMIAHLIPPGPPPSFLAIGVLIAVWFVVIGVLSKLFAEATE